MALNLTDCYQPLSCHPRKIQRLGAVLIFMLILAVSLAGLRNTLVVCPLDCADSSQILSVADDADGDDGEACILNAASLAFAPPPSHPYGEPCAHFFSSLKSPPATPPPKRA